MSLAQKLCNEIVEPALKAPSGEEHDNYSGQTFASISKPIKKVSRSVSIEKRRVISKVLPKNANKAGKVINQFKSKEVVKKHFYDTAVNTLVSGPLRCDTDCVTIVRKRDHFCTCGLQKCNTSKPIAKEMQTLDVKSYTFSDKALDVKSFIFSDKACAHIIETVSCGTQFMSEILNEIEKHSADKSALGGFKAKKGFYLDKPREKSYVKELYKNNCNKSSETPLQLATLDPCARRWDLSKHPRRGPDF